MYYKFLDECGYSTYQQTKWHLPTKTGKPGRAMPKAKGKLVACENGYHLCREQDLIFWLGPVLYEAEALGDELVEVNEGEMKVVVRSARLLRQIEIWNERATRLFAADCAEHVLHLFERERPGDMRPRDAITAARAFTRGEINAAAKAAAWAAAEAAARAAAWAAAKAAAEDAAEDAARAAEREWQSARLLQYIRGEVE